MYEWVPISSSWVAAAAYEREGERILVEFNDGARIWYGECTPINWEEFMAPGQSKGQYVHQVLEGHPYGRLEG